MRNILSHLKTKPFLFFILIAVIIAGLLTFMLLNKPSNKTTTNPSSQTNQLEEKEVLLFFDPNTITASSGGTVKASVSIDSGDAMISFVKLDVSWDPKLFSNVTLTPFKDPASAMSNSLISQVVSEDKEKGSIVITYTLINGAIEQKGQAVLAKFSAVYKGGKQASVSIFSDSTVATKSQDYRLKVGRVNLDVTPR